MKKISTFFALISALFAASTSGAATIVPVDSSSSALVGTGIFVNTGDLVNITATGTVVYIGSTGASVDANGAPVYTTPTFAGSVLVPSAHVLSLVGAIGAEPVVEGQAGWGAGFIGSNYSMNSISSGELFLGFNDDIFSDNTGSFLVSIDVASVPLPAAAWLFGSALLGLAGIARRKKA